MNRPIYREALGLTALNAKLTVTCAALVPRDKPTPRVITVYIAGAGVISSGVIKIEEAPYAGYTGLWSLLETVNAADVSGGASIGKHYDAAFGAVRARVSTAIGGGGSVDLHVVGY